MASIGYTDSTRENGSEGCGAGGGETSRRGQGTGMERRGGRGDAGGPSGTLMDVYGPGGDASPARGGDPGTRVDGGAGLPRRAGTASCKMCRHMDVCKAYDAALLANTQFATMRFINVDTPIIVPDRLAERCSKYTPPNRSEIAEALRHELR